MLPTPPPHPILFVVLYPGQSYLEVGVETPDGVGRRIKLMWQGRITTDVPPPTWAISARAEAELQRAPQRGLL